MSLKEYWYPWFPTKFRQDTMHLTAEQDGIYRRLIDHYMETGAPLPSNHVALARIAGVSVETFNSHSDAILIFCRKSGENLHIKRCDGILSDQAERTKSYSDRKRGKTKKPDAKSVNEIKGKKSAENLNAISRSVTRQDNTLELDTNVSNTPAPPKKKSPALQSEAQEAFRLYNELAERIGLTRAQVLNSTRMARIASRLKDAGGIEGWKMALEKVEASDFLAGRAKDFKASLDFMLQDQSFTKIMEGNYDNGTKQSASSTNRGSTYDAGVEGFSRAAARHAREGRDGMAEGGAAPSDLFPQTKGAQSS